MQNSAILEIFHGPEIFPGKPLQLNDRVSLFIAEQFHRLGLTPREKLIVSLVLQGCSNKEIARHCAITIQTVKDHLKNVYRKSGTHTRSALIAQLIGTRRL
jgi:DNA-binding CsgD family transcriptional regulator